MDDRRYPPFESILEENRALRETIASLRDALGEQRADASTDSPRPRSDIRLADFATFAIEKLSDGAHLISKEGIIRYVNDATCRMLGYEREELMGMSMLSINPHLTQEIWDAVWKVTRRDKTQAIETEHITKDGRVFPVEVIANHFLLDGQEYSCAFARDITDRKRLESRIRQSEKMEAIGQLAGGVAHDFNNQLAGIVGYADMLTEALTDNPSLRCYAEAILTAAKRSADLTEKLLAYARQGAFLAIPVDVNPLIDEVIQVLGRSIDKRISIEKRLSRAPVIVNGDPSLLQNAILNLGINARDAMPDGGRLTFATEAVTLSEDQPVDSPFQIFPGPFVRICVSDTGCGIDDALQHRIFEPFFTTKEQGKGTGMGLAAVYGTVKHLNGAITVESTPGSGTSMTLFLPRVADRDHVSVPPPSAVPPMENPPRVLLVDDEPMVRTMAAQMLTRLGCEVEAAENGESAVALYREAHDRIDLILLDAMMPDLSGKETFARLREINPEVVAIVASGYSLAGDVQKILDMGAKAFLPKPFRMAELAETLSATLGEERWPLRGAP